ncbi:MAG TPA: questin oxidase family protein [Acidimicrobiales bacterium]|nr:questin oxidase family protein [Acidimicrobiales bacterium]
MSQSSISTLQELLDEELGSDPTTIRGLTNHLPMALVAKERLGADADELIRFAAAYSKRIAPLHEPENRLNEKTWQSAIGQSAAAADLRSYFVRLIREVGQDEALRTHLPALLPGVGGAGFHGVIRLAYAIEVSSPSRIAAGLAYLAEVGRPLSPLVRGEITTQDPAKVFAELSKSPDWSAPAPQKTIDEEMHIVAANDLFDAVVSSLEITDDTEDKLTEAALHVFASSNDFTALHGVTGLAAISSIRPWIDDGHQVSRFTFQALTAAYLSIGAPPLWSKGRLDEFVGSNKSDPSEVRSTAALSDDEHVSKLVYTAQRSWERTNDPLYLAVAARKALPVS